MAQTRLNEDMNFVQRAPLEITALDGDLNIIAKLDDEPNDVGGLSSQELKAEFDKAGNTIKTYLNKTLIPELLASDATEQVRAEAEAKRAAAESERCSAEAGRASAEASRVLAENLRASAEAERLQSEASRNEAEAARIAAESGRDKAYRTAEAERKATFAAAEAEREDMFTAAEAGRDTAEQARAAAERERAAGESDRIIAEENRENQETGYVAQAKAYAEAAAKSAQDADQSAGGGVRTFCGRTGAVSPQIGDYTAAMVGAYTRRESLSEATKDRYMLNGAAVPDDIFGQIKTTTDQMLSDLGGKAAMEIVEYVGDGTTRKTIQFQHPPQCLFIIKTKQMPSSEVKDVRGLCPKSSNAWHDDGVTIFRGQNVFYQINTHGYVTFEGNSVHLRSNSVTPICNYLDAHFRVFAFC